MVVEEFNVVLAGVGGQGILLAAEVLGAAALRDGLNVRVSEIHGMAQRGGAVTSTVRIGERVLAPTVLEGRADVLLGFEGVEVLRSLRFACERTLVVLSDERIPPPEVSSKIGKYPSVEEIVSEIREFTQWVVVVESARIAKKAGSVLARNSVLLGALVACGTLPVKTESLLEALRELVPKKHVDVNVEAFKLGYDYVRKRGRKKRLSPVGKF